MLTQGKPAQKQIVLKFIALVPGKVNFAGQERCPELCRILEKPSMSLGLSSCRLDPLEVEAVDRCSACPQT